MLRVILAALCGGPNDSIKLLQEQQTEPPGVPDSIPLFTGGGGPPRGLVDVHAVSVLSPRYVGLLLIQGPHAAKHLVYLRDAPDHHTAVPRQLAVAVGPTSQPGVRKHRRTEQTPSRLVGDRRAEEGRLCHYVANPCFNDNKNKGQRAAR